jgi:diguanylate cyclase (GGDEF)-like protein
MLSGILVGVQARSCAAQERPEPTVRYISATLNQNTEPQQNSPGRLQLVSSGATAVDRARNEARTMRLRPVIEQVRFNQQLLATEQGVTAGPGDGELEIQFSAPETPASDHVHLRYRLVGFDQDWTEAGKERQATYDKLPPGHYLFELEAVDGVNVWGPRITDLQIVVTPRYWQTDWFPALCVILLAVLGFVVHIVRVRYLLSRSHRLEDQVHQSKGELQLARKVAEDAQRALKAQAMKDSLTDLWNRRVIFEMLEKEVSRAQREQLPIAVVMIDLDHFKNVNDTYGHLTGDAVLQEASRRIAELMRPYDFAGRYGGEEFLIVLPGCSAMNGVQRAEDFRRAIAETPVATACGPLTVTCSLGVASHDGIMPAEDLIHQADEALYRAKRLGRNCVRAGV